LVEGVTTSVGVDVKMVVVVEGMELTDALWDVGLPITKNPVTISMATAATAARSLGSGSATE
jgi:hypothetical protein